MSELTQTADLERFCVCDGCGYEKGICRCTEIRICRCIDCGHEKRELRNSLKITDRHEWSTIVRCDVLDKLLNELVALRKIVKEYRADHGDDCGQHNGHDFRCPICIQSDALLRWLK